MDSRLTELADALDRTPDGVTVAQHIKNLTTELGQCRQGFQERIAAIETLRATIAQRDATIEALREEVLPLLADAGRLLREVVDTHACRWDHHGWCQEHMSEADDLGRCWNTRARDLIAAIPATPTDGTGGE